MAARTNSELIQANTDAIRKLEQSVATLHERLANLRREVDSLSADFDRSAATQVDLAVLQHRVAELERIQRNRAQYLWALFGIVVGTILSFVGTVILRLLPMPQ
jgi:uncharacterized small protein (DUF1192 family)